MDSSNEISILREQSEQAQATAAKANAAKSEFLSRMTHEIRTPMNAILGMTYIAQNSNDIGKIKSCLAKIDAAGKHLMNVINDILDMSRIDADRVELSGEEFHLEKLIAEIALVAAPQMNERKQTLTVSLSRELPAVYRGDALRLSQVLTHLLSNAVKFSPEGSEIKLSTSPVKLGPETTEICFSVQDFGIGISKESQARLFSPFEQADGGITRKFGGAGLGLAISKKLVNLMGGEIRVDSELGKGSTFTFTVVLKNAASETDTVKNTQTPQKGERTMSDSNDLKQFLPYIDAADGLNRVRDMKKLYAKLLKSYLEAAGDAKIAEISELLAVKKMPEAQAAVHTLKGVSANLSVKRMFELSLALETCIKESRDTTAAFFDLKKCQEITLPLVNKLIPLLEV
ncbi:hypothetical protein FACS1894211_11760 [Clostridia bacterium]|nr:hypothetical protein FACS1894211_11760 [Clostridia bacterium]